MLKSLCGFLWPIRRDELKFFFPITGMMFCILLVQNIARALKDGIVNTLIGTEIISFLKLWGVTPAAFLVAFVYMKLVSMFDARKIVYCSLFLFLAFFIVFSSYIFPNYRSLHPDDAYVASLISAHPHFKWFILLWAKWSFSAFYIVVELWPNIIVSLLFWQFVNQITNVEQSRRFYPLFGLFGQSALIVSGFFLQELPYLTDLLTKLRGSSASFDECSVQVVLWLSSFMICGAIFCFWYINSTSVPSKIASKFILEKKGVLITFSQSVKMVLESRYILLMSVVVACYGAAINLAETPFKAHITEATKITKAASPIAGYSSFVGSNLVYTGISTIVLVLVNSVIIRSFGWAYSAVITPIVLFVTGMLFFLTSNFESFRLVLAQMFSVDNPIMLIIICGMMQNALSKATKYTFFDTTKEMAYVPLNADLKTNGKAAVDLIAVKVGKAASSLFQSLAFIILPSASYASISIYLMCIFAAVCSIWVYSVLRLGIMYNKLAAPKLKVASAN